jgi:hypothetical protein
MSAVMKLREFTSYATSPAVVVRGNSVTVPELSSAKKSMMFLDAVRGD